MKIAAPTTPDDQLEPFDAGNVDLGGRYLVKYIRTAELDLYTRLAEGTNKFRATEIPGTHFLTPTALRKKELVKALNLPSHMPVPTHAILVNPSLVRLWGPRSIRMGSGIEFLCLEGLPLSAIATPGWAIQV